MKGSLLTVVRLISRRCFVHAVTLRGRQNLRPAVIRIVIEIRAEATALQSHNDYMTRVEHIVSHRIKHGCWAFAVEVPVQCQLCMLQPPQQERALTCRLGHLYLPSACPAARCKSEALGWDEKLMNLTMRHYR
jgi:hypothetical protein